MFDFDNIIRLIALAGLFFIALGGEATGLIHFGVSNSIVFWILATQCILGCIMVAAVDPTYIKGYAFAAMMMPIIAAMCFLLVPHDITPRLMIGVAAVAMSVTYITRRKINNHQAIRRLAEFSSVEPWR